MCLLGSNMKKKAFMSTSCLSNDMHKDFQAQVSTKAALSMLKIKYLSPPKKWDYTNKGQI